MDNIAIDNLRLAYEELSHEVRRALAVRVGQTGQLRQVRASVFRFLECAQQVRITFLNGSLELNPK